MTREDSADTQLLGGEEGWPLRKEAGTPGGAPRPTPPEPVEPPAGPPGRRRFPIALVLAATLLGVVAGGAALGLGGLGRDGGTTPPVTAAGTPRDGQAQPASKPSRPSHRAQPAAKPDHKGVRVPLLVGWTREKAVAELHRFGFEPKVVLVRSEGDPGRVVSETPSGSRAPKGSAVTLEVARPSVPKPATAPVKTATVPNVFGYRVPGAQTALRQRGLVAAVAYVPSDRPAGTVASQSPAAGTSVKQGSHVTVNVSKGRPPQTVPDVVGDTQAQAVSQLRSAGFDASVVDSTTSDPDEDGVVLKQSPAGGTSARRGSTVTITVARYTGP